MSVCKCTSRLWICCCRLKDVTSLSYGWTVIKKVKISALKFLMLFEQSWIDQPLATRFCMHALSSDLGFVMLPLSFGVWPNNSLFIMHQYFTVVPAYPIWAYYAHGRQRWCQEDPVSLLSGRLEKTTRSSPHHVAQHRPTGSETTPPYAPRSSRFGSEPPSVEDDVDVWRYTIVRVACQKRRRRRPCRCGEIRHIQMWWKMVIFYQYIGISWKQ